jgi:hypothetical protein
MSPLETIGTTDCPVCGQTVRVFRRGFLDPTTNRAIYAISLHWFGSTYCPGQGKRVKLSDVTR